MTVRGSQSSGIFSKKGGEFLVMKCSINQYEGGKNMGTLDDIIDGIHKKISKNPLQWDEDASVYVATVKLSKKEQDILNRHDEKFVDDGLRGWSNDGDFASFYYEIDDDEIDDIEDG